LAQRGQGGAGCQRGRGGSEQVPAVKGSRRSCRDLECNGLDLGVVEYRGEHSVVGTHEPMPMYAEGQCSARAANAGIYHDQVDCPRGKAVPGTPQDVGGRSNVPRSGLVRHIDQGGARSTTEKDALHFGEVGIGGAEVGQEGDDLRRSSPPQNR
jgi:hypothetical protein